MQAKGIVKLFLFLLIAICAGQLIYLFPTQKVEKDAQGYAKKMTANSPAEQKTTLERTAYAHYLDSMSSIEVMKIPMIGSYTYQDCKSRQLALGLDLKGGMSVLLRVDLQDFMKSLSGNSTDPDFLKALEASTKTQKETQGDYIDIFAKEFKKTGKSLASVFARSAALKGTINNGSSDAAVQAAIRNEANGTVEETFKRLKQRIDKLGVVQPNVSLDKSRDLILVELPGIENPERARSFLQAAAKLEFWDIYRSYEGVAQGILAADNRLKGDTTAITAVADSTKKDTSAAAIANKEMGPLVKLLIPVDPQASAPGTIAQVEKNKREALMAYLNRPDIATLFPNDLVFSLSKDPDFDAKGKKTNRYTLYALRKTRGTETGAALDGSCVTKAFPSQGEQGNLVVSLQMNTEGANKWASITEKAARDNRKQVAVVLDGEVVSAPSVNEKIGGGSSQISGNYTVQEAQDFANILQVGKLPARTEIIQESNVGPSLGAENISKSLTSLLMAALAIILFMIVYYAGGGIVAVIALLANLFFIIGALTSYGTVLTLPGIAGIVLTMGIAVDANVIVYERIREELAHGKALLQAIKDGFVGATPAIVDGNVTNIIAAMVLGYYGLGPVKGFAITLMIGVLFTLFTSLLVSRLMIEWWVGNRGKDLTFSRPSTANWFKGINIDWMSLRKYGYAFSVVFILAGIGSFFTRGFDLGIDFKGGYSYTIQFDKGKKINVDELQKTLYANFDNQSTIVKAVSTENTFNVTTSYKVAETNTAEQEKVLVKLYEGLTKLGWTTSSIEEFKKTGSSGTHLTSFSKTTPLVADDITKSSIIANVLALVLIAIYIFIRFRKWQYSVGTVIALFHDVLFILACFSMLHGILPFSLEVDQAIIAAVLTISAYSMNDTVIVYDRIREYTRTYSKNSMRTIINDAINSTLSRTIITSFNVLLVVLILFIFGGSSIKGFAFALVVGIFIGTYSSIFIASPVMLDLSKNLDLSDGSSDAATAENSNTKKSLQEKA